jgi:hypothetical protein
VSIDKWAGIGFHPKEILEMADELSKEEKKQAMPRKEKKLGFLDRMIMIAQGENLPLGCKDDPAQEQFPELWRCLTETDAGKENVKEPGTLTIRMGPDGALVSLNDRSLNFTADASCKRLGDVFEAIESALNGESGQLRTNNRRAIKVRPKKKKQ